MKKLTASIFASLLTVVTVGAANANIASQGYVDEKVGTVTTALGSKADQTALDTLSGRVTTAEGDIDTLQSDVSGLKTTKADKTELGNYATKTELATKADSATVTALNDAAEKIANRVTEVSDASDDAHYPTAKAVWDIVQAETADIASTGDLSALTTRVTTAEGEIDTLQTDMAGKANTADLGDLATLDAVGSTQITDGSITSADISATAAIKKTQLETGVQTSLGLADTALQEGDLADYAKTAEVASTYETKANASATYETKANASATYETKANASATYETKTNAAATYATKEEIADLATDENLALKQDKTDNNLATTNKTVVGAINEVKTTADAAIPAPDGECSNPTNKCVLTYNNSAYAWEVIERGSNGQ